MVSIFSLLASAFLAVVLSLSAPQISGLFQSWDLRIAFGMAVFVIVQFGLLTPLRMWRDAVWVQNVEKSLNDLWDLHEEGTVILNEHADHYMIEHPNWKAEPDATNKWVNEWIKRVNTWAEQTTATLATFSPLDARRFKNVVTFHPDRLQGMTPAHIFHVNLLATKLERLGDMLEKHHPSQLPE
ncbi:MAG: hypothetical protein HYX87_00935 [Chloroflexi bacterium]|nr:hypothetical protein [Chloroflexota bacterium]